MLKIVPLEEDLVQATVDDITTGTSTNYSNLMVISPSQRLLLFIKEALNKKVNNSYFPPQLLTIDQFVLQLFNLNFSGFKIISEIESALVIYKTVKKIFPDTIYTGGRVANSFSDFFPWALIILKAIEEMLVEGELIGRINEDIFEEFAKLGEYHAGYKDFIAKLPGVVDGFKASLLENKVYTRGITYRMVAGLADNSLLKIPGAEAFIFSGTGALNFSEAKLMKFIFNTGQAKLIIRSDPAALNNKRSPFFLHHQTLKTLDLLPDIDREEISWNRFSEKVRLYCLPNIESQMLQVADILDSMVKVKKNREELKKIAVILPESASLIPFVHGVVSRLSKAEKKIPFNITLGYPFVRTPLYQLIRFIIKCAESREAEQIFFRDYLSLLRHPYIKLSRESGDEDEPLKRGIHLIEDIINRENLLYFSTCHIEDRVNHILEKSSGLTAGLKEKIALEIKNLHSTFVASKNLSLEEMGKFLKQAVLAIEKNKKQHLFLGEYITSAVSTLDCVIEFARENDTEVCSADFASLTSLITYYFSGTRIYFEGSPLKGIQIMGMLESRGLTFDEVILLDVLEGVLPQRLKYDPLLPYDIRKTFGIWSYSEWETLFSFNFFSLVGSAKKIHILWTDIREGGEKTEKSRFVERISYEIEKRGGASPVVIRNSCPINIETVKLKSIKKTDLLKENLKNSTFSSSALEIYIQCPLRYYYSRIQGLEEKEELSSDPDVGELGTLIHSALEVFYRNLDWSWRPNEIESQLKMILAHEFEKCGFGMSSGIGKIRFWVLKDKLKDFIFADLLRLKESKIQLMSFEEKISVSLPFAGKTVSIKGRIDRIEKENGILRLIDYKTGADFSPRINRRIKDFLLEDIKNLPEPEYLGVLKEIHRVYRVFQMLLYALMYKYNTGSDYKTIDAAYIFLKPAEKFFRPIFTEGNSPQIISEEDKKSLMDNFSHNLMKIFEDIFERDTFLANPRDNRYCGYCPFQVPCGNI